MKISELFSQFKRINPDPQYSEKSKRMVLSSLRETMPVRERGVMVFLRALETGAALVLAGFFILLATGGFSGNKYLAPVQYAVIDPSGLQAEAQAIDIQIRLANLDYSEVTSTAAQSTTPTISAVMRPLMAAGLGTASSTSGGTASSTSGGTASSTASSTPLTVDQALQALSQ